MLTETNKNLVSHLDMVFWWWNKIMQKDELIQLHTFLLQLKTHLEEIIGTDGIEQFEIYNVLNVTPYQVYKSKREHTLAVFTLSKGIADLLIDNRFTGLEKISSRLEMMAERFMTEKEKDLINRVEVPVSSWMHHHRFDRISQTCHRFQSDVFCKMK